MENNILYNSERSEKGAFGVSEIRILNFFFIYFGEKKEKEKQVKSTSVAKYTTCRCI